MLKMMIMKVMMKMMIVKVKTLIVKVSGKVTHTKKKERFSGLSRYSSVCVVGLRGDPGS